MMTPLINTYLVPSAKKLMFLVKLAHYFVQSTHYIYHLHFFVLPPSIQTYLDMHETIWQVMGFIFQKSQRFAVILFNK